MLVDLIEIVPGLLVDMPIVKVHLLRVRLETGLHGLRAESLPVEVCEPRVVLDLVDAADTESLMSFAHEALIDEVCRLFGIVIRKVPLAEVCLLVPNRISDGSPVGPEIRSAPNDALVTDHADSKVVRSHGVILFEHDLRRHVVRCANLIQRTAIVALIQLRGDVEAGQNVICASFQDFFRLYVPMDDT